MDLGSLVVGVVGLAALCLKLTSFLKYASARDWTSVKTQVVPWVAGVAGVFLYGASDFGPGIIVADIPLVDMAAASKVILGMSIGSLGSTAYDFRAAIDNGDTAKEPKLHV